MAVLALTDAYISLAGNVISDHCTKVEFPVEADDLDVTAFGGVWRSRIAGLLDGTLNLSLNQDYAASSIDSIMWAAFIARTPIAFEIRPTSAAASPTNPKWTGTVIMTGYSPISGDVGAVDQFDVSFPVAGPAARATA